MTPLVVIPLVGAAILFWQKLPVKNLPRPRSLIIRRPRVKTEGGDFTHTRHLKLPLRRAAIDSDMCRRIIGRRADDQHSGAVSWSSLGSLRSSALKPPAPHASLRVVELMTAISGNPDTKDRVFNVQYHRVFEQVNDSNPDTVQRTNSDFTPIFTNDIVVQTCTVWR